MDQADRILARWRAMPIAEAREEYRDLGETDPERCCEVGDRDPELHARLLRCGRRPRRYRGTKVAAYRRVAGRWVAERVVVDHAPRGCERRARTSHGLRPGHRHSSARSRGSGRQPDDPGDPAGSSSAVALGGVAA